MNKYREVECGGCAPHVQIHTDRNRADKSAEATASERAVGTISVGPGMGRRDEYSVTWLAPFHVLGRGEHRLYLSPPASIPAAEVQALVERLRVPIAYAREQNTMTFSNEWVDCRNHTRREIADELAKLARDYAPEVSQKPPSPREK